MGTVLILGLLVGSIIGGHIGDHFGRKKAIFGSIALTVPVIIGSGYVNDYNGKRFFPIVFYFPIICSNLHSNCSNALDLIGTHKNLTISEEKLTQIMLSKIQNWIDFYYLI